MSLFRGTAPFALFAVVLPLGACNTEVAPPRPDAEAEHRGASTQAMTTAEFDVRLQLGNFNASRYSNGIQAYCAALVSDKLDGKQFVWCDGPLRPSSSTVVNGDTIFNIGSITKAFVAELLADEVLRGERCYTDGLHQRLVANGLDESPQVSRNEKMAVELRHLATHMAGFSKNPNVEPAPSSFPTSELYVAYLDNEMACNPFTTPTSLGGGSPGTNFTHCASGTARALAPELSYSYSNMGFSLLAEALNKPGIGNTWSALLYQRFLSPLGMTRTGSVYLTAAEKTNMAWANDDASAVGSWWGWWPGGAGGSGMHSTANDLLRWMKFHMGKTQLPASRYPSPFTCGPHPAGPVAGDPFGGTGPSDMAVNEAWRKRWNEGRGSSPYEPDSQSIALAWNVEGPTGESGSHPDYTIVDKGGDAGSQDFTSFHAKTAFAIRRSDGKRSSAVTILTVVDARNPNSGNAANARSQLAKNILDSLETL